MVRISVNNEDMVIKIEKTANLFLVTYSKLKKPEEPVGKKYIVLKKEYTENVTQEILFRTGGMTSILKTKALSFKILDYGHA